MASARPAGRDEVGALAAMLARAFATDPVTLALFPRPAGRVAALRRFFTFQLRHHYLPRGLVETTPGLESAALWMPPVPGPPRQRDLLALPMLIAGLGAAYPYARRLGQFLGQRHPREPHYYLGILGTDPAAQRRGHASALVEAGTARCDAEAVSAYLECSNEANLAFYARFGFAVREEVLAGVRGPRLWLMERAARAAG